MNCDVGEETEGLENELWRRWSDGKVGEWALNELWRRWSDGKVGEWALQNSLSNLSVTSPTSQLILQLFRRFSYVTAHSLTLPLLHLRHSSFSNPSVALPTTQLILPPLRCFSYVTAHSPTRLSLLLRHRLFTYVTWRAAHVWKTERIQNFKSLSIPY